MADPHILSADAQVRRGSPTRRRSGARGGLSLLVDSGGGGTAQIGAALSERADTLAMKVRDPSGWACAGAPAHEPGAPAHLGPEPQLRGCSPRGGPCTGSPCCASPKPSSDWPRWERRPELAPP
jgi:hypothetical protein